MADGATFGSGAGRLGFASPLWTGFVPALIALAGLAVIDAQADWVITGFFAVVPFTTALSVDATPACRAPRLPRGWPAGAREAR